MADIYPLFGGYQGCMDAPYDVVQKHILLWHARNNVAATKNSTGHVREMTEEEHDAAIGW